MNLDCDRCPARGTGCDGCLVAFVLDELPHRDGQPLDAREAAAVQAFRAAGLVSRVESTRARATSTTAALAAAG